MAGALAAAHRRALYRSDYRNIGIEQTHGCCIQGVTVFNPAISAFFVARCTAKVIARTKVFALAA